MIHLVGLPHTSLDAERFSSCAFTAKAAKLCRILEHELEREVTVYWGGDDVNEDVTEFVSILSEEEQAGYFGAWDPGVLPVIEWTADLPYWQTFNERVIERIKRRIMPGDFVAVQGSIHQSVVDAFADSYTCIEPMVGYDGICANTFCCFESYSHMHYRYGAHYIQDGRAMDCVIPNYWDPNDFERDTLDDYAVFLGRLIIRKGPHVAAEITREAGMRLLMAGAGVTQHEPGRILTAEGMVITGDHVTYLGTVDPRQRKALLSHAAVMLVPTLYIEPFGGVHAEALLSGCPVVAPDYGVFTETIDPGFNGYRYRSFEEAVTAVEWASKFEYIQRGHIRTRAVERFSLEAAANKYEAWLRRLRNLRNDGAAGWYARCDHTLEMEPYT